MCPRRFNPNPRATWREFYCVEGNVHIVIGKENYYLSADFAIATLKFNADGSLDLYIQNKNPDSDRESNWLPAPKSRQLGLTLRLYAPTQNLLLGREPAKDRDYVFTRYAR